MRTPKAYTELLKNKTISEDMLSDCIFSVNKRAKNYRDKSREIRHSYRNGFLYTDKSDAEKGKYYREKEFLLSLLKPICVHQEFGGYERIRVYDYEKRYNRLEKSGAFVWENCYYSREEEREVWFGDYEDKNAPRYRYYLFYQLGTHSFHSPIDAMDIPEDMEIKNIGELETFGMDTCNLLSTQFVNKVMFLIYSGDYTLTFSENVADKKPVWEEMPYFIKIPETTSKTSSKRKTTFVPPEIKIETVLIEGENEIDADDYILSEINSYHGPSKETVIRFAKENGMEISSKTKREDAADFLYKKGLMRRCADLWKIGIKKYDYLRAGMTESEYNRLSRSKKLKIIDQYEAKGRRFNYNVNIYSLDQYLMWRNTGTVV